MNKPFVQAHRGASAAAPENTLAAFRLAREMQAHSVELDVMLTRDGIPVISHDGVLGRAIEGTEPVAELTLAELKQRDAGRWKDARFAGERVPTLDEALDCLQGLVVNIELKSNREDGLEEKVADAICRHGGPELYIASSFHPEAIARIRRLLPGLQVAYIYMPQHPYPLGDLWPADLAPIDALHPLHTMVDEAYMERARAEGLLVRAWTVDDPAEMRRLAALKVESIVTNAPDVCRNVLAAL